MTEIRDQEIEEQTGLSRQVVVWAIDAFPESKSLAMKTAAALKALFPSALIVPVYILSEESFASQGFSRLLRLTLKRSALQAILRLTAGVGDLRFLHLKKPRVLNETSASRDECAYRLLRFAHKIRADAIAVGSHGKPAISFLMGRSFSESLLRMSRLPILVIGPASEPLPLTPKTIVFATDFSAACARGFDKILNLAAGFDAELHLFHKRGPPIRENSRWQIRQFYRMGEPSINELDLATCQNEVDPLLRAQVWVEYGRLRGIKTRLLCENFREPVSKAIVHYMSQLDDGSALVALVTQASPFASALLGSVTRDVVRTSRWPVFIAASSAA